MYPIASCPDLSLSFTYHSCFRSFVVVCFSYIFILQRISVIWMLIMSQPVKVTN